MSAAENVQLQQNASPALMAVASSAWLGRADLPDTFEVIVTDFALATADTETRLTAYDSWLAAREELRHRNYAIWEYRDEERQCFVATCAKRPNYQAHPRRPAAPVERRETDEN